MATTKKTGESGMLMTESKISTREILARFMAISGVRTTLIVAPDGLLIDGVSSETSDDLETLASITATGLAIATSMGQELGRGKSLAAILEYETGLVALEPVEDLAMLVIISDSLDNLGRIRLALRKNRDDIVRAVSQL